MPWRIFNSGRRKWEVWLGTDLLKQVGFSDTLENHFRMVDRLDQEMI
jgi:hypothetical protein